MIDVTLQDQFVNFTAYEIKPDLTNYILNVLI